MDFKIIGLPVATFKSYFAMSDAELKTRGVLRLVADRRPGFPCRVSLRDADPGESVLLLNYEHLAVATPYQSRYAIFVRQNAEEARLEMNEIPEMLLARLLSVRAFGYDAMLLDADVIEGRSLALAIDRMLDPQQVAYLHIHNAKPGCFAARVDRA
jgi:Protein of unknown function (DUF1203)